jgi:hypothetical protein
MDDGSERLVPVPQSVHVDVGSPVAIFEGDDGRLVYKWGD